MSTMPEDPHAACRERLSALMDGELSGPVLHQACGHWREAAASRSTWHAYHVIGDVLRSDDLAGGAHRSAEFLAVLRKRLASEPVVLAPMTLTRAPAAAASSGSRPAIWRRASTIAAGAVAVAGVVLLVRTPPDGGRVVTGVPLAQAPVGTRPATFAAPVGAGLAPAPIGSGLASTPSFAEPRALLPGDPLIRDARLDRYLAAHQQFVGSSAFGAPAGFLRAATSESVRR